MNIETTSSSPLTSGHPDPDSTAKGLLSLGRKQSILLAEDDHSSKWALKRLLETDGYRVEAVEDGSELLYELEPVILREPGIRPPDLIVTDVRMPGINVFNVIEQLRDNGYEIPVIIMTGYGSDRIRHRVNQIGRAFYFEKPIDIGELEATLERALS